VRGCDDTPIIIGMNIPNNMCWKSDTVDGFGSFQNLKDIGFDIVVSCCTTKEIGHISSICNVLKLDHQHIEWEMSGLTNEPLVDHVKKLASSFIEGKRIVICCPNGIGSSVIFAGVLVTYMMNQGLLDQSLMTATDLVSSFRMMGPPNVIISKTQYDHLMELIGMSKQDIYPWYQIHDPQNVTILTLDYIKQYKNFLHQGIKYPIMMNEYSFSTCVHKHR
jgi:galactitol-specific phosphotransferase system IIB component